MASTFPGAIDSFTDPLSGSALNSPSHSAQHADLNDAAEKIETYMGLVKVIPTSATNGTVGATGIVTVGNAVSSVTVSGCFTSLYNAYKLVSRGVVCSTEGSASLQLTSSGTPLITGYYGALIFSGTGTLQQVVNTNATQFGFICAHGNTAGLSLDVDIHSPAKTEMTWVANASYMRFDYYGSFNGYSNSSTAYDGFKIFPQSGTLTGGTITVYGYRI